MDRRRLHNGETNLSKCVDSGGFSVGSCDTKWDYKGVWNLNNLRYIHHDKSLYLSIATIVQHLHLRFLNCWLC